LFFFSSRRRHTRFSRDWSSDVCSSDLACAAESLPAYVHAPYLINFGSHTEATVERSVESLRHSLRRGREIGALGVVVHTGSATEIGRASRRERGEISAGGARAGGQPSG